jgi:hypothetical protein
MPTHPWKATAEHEVLDRDSLGPVPAKDEVAKPYQVAIPYPEYAREAEGLTLDAGGRSASGAFVRAQSAVEIAV